MSDDPSIAKNVPQIWREADDLVIMHLPSVGSDMSLTEEGAARMLVDLADVMKHKFTLLTGSQREIEAKAPDNTHKKIAYKLLADCFTEELAHLRLRMIRDAQQPRFEALKDSHPEIYEDFMKARTDCHDELKTIRAKRIETLTAIIEGRPL